MRGSWENKEHSFKNLQNENVGPSNKIGELSHQISLFEELSQTLNSKVQNYESEYDGLEKTYKKMVFEKKHLQWAFD